MQDTADAIKLSAANIVEEDRTRHEHHHYYVIMEGDDIELMHRAAKLAGLDNNSFARAALTLAAQQVIEELG